MKKIFFSITEWPFGKDIALLMLRLAFGLSMLFGHGLGKWERLFGEGPVKFADPFGLGAEFSLVLAVFAEVLCAVFISIGLFTRASLIPLIITMATAVFIIHGDDDFSGKEKALLYLMAYLALFFTGPGKLSLDNLFGKKPATD